MQQPTNLDLSFVREQFSALQRTGKSGNRCLFLDAPGGTQVPQTVITAMSDYLLTRNANTHGLFQTSRETDRTIALARQAVADFLGAKSPKSIHFGANMTSITFHLSRVLANSLKPGDEIIVTRLDHDANISPWLSLQKLGIKIKWLDFDPERCTLRMEQLPELIGGKTRLIAVGYASNAVGTINDVRKIVRLARQAGVLSYVDAVHYAPHGLIDVTELDCDFLVCSAYKFFGPHLGAAYIRPEVAEPLVAEKVRPQLDNAPEKFETGTLNHEGIAGVIAAIDYLAALGLEATAKDAAAVPRRQRIAHAMQQIAQYERELSLALIDGLQRIPGVYIHGITDPALLSWRTPTISITLAKKDAAQVAMELGEQDIFVWDGNFYAIEVVARLALEKRGGLVRIGLAHYNTIEEVDRFLQVLTGIAK